jgi:hypothetical protein
LHSQKCTVFQIDVALLARRPILAAGIPDEYSFQATEASLAYKNRARAQAEESEKKVPFRGKRRNVRAEGVERLIPERRDSIEVPKRGLEPPLP